MSVRAPSSSDAAEILNPRRSADDSSELLTPESLQRWMYDFYAVTGAIDDIGTVYRNLRPIWANSTTSHLVDPCLNILSKIPSSRLAVLNFIGMLSHEATHLFLSKKENPHIATDTSNIERAVRKLTAELRRLITTTRSKGLAFDVLVWACNLFVEICKYNYERPIAKNAGISPPSLLSLFDSCPAISNIIKLSDKAIALLLASAPDECLSILIDASGHGFYFAWIWLHIAVSFPDTIVAHLLKIGTQEFKQYLIAMQSSQAPVEYIDSYKQKFVSVSDVFAFLATQNSAELRNATREIIAKDKEILENGSASEHYQNLSLPFLVRMVTNSPDILRFLVHNVNDLVTINFVISGAKFISQLNKKCLLPILPNTEYTYTAFMRKMVFYLDPDALANVMELALPIAFDDHVFEKFASSEQSFNLSMKETAQQIMTEIIGILVSSVHNQTMFSIGENALLRRCVNSHEFLRLLIQYSMSGGERSKLFIPYIHAFCIASGSVRTSEVIARYIVEARDENELAALSALLTSLIIFSPSIPEEAVVNFFANRTMFMLEKRREFMKKAIEIDDLMDTDFCDDDFFDVKWLHNLHTLNEWEKLSDDEHAVNYIRFEMTKHYGELVTEVLRWTLDTLICLERNKEAKDSARIEAIRDSVTQAAISFCSSLGPPSVLEPRYPYKLSAQFASLIIVLLGYVGREDDPTAFSLFTTACACAADFLSSQVGYVREQFIMHLLDEALAKAKMIFGCSSLNVWDTELRFSGDYQQTDNSLDFLNYGSDDSEESLFDLARKLPLQPQKAVYLAHSGIIGRGAKRLSNEEVKKGDTMRRLIFFECLQRFCNAVGADGSLVPYHQVFKQLAVRLTDHVCSEGLSASFVWEEWEQAREVIPRYIAVSKKLTEIPIIWDAMLALTEVHPCLWYCCPLLKAYLAAIMIQFENSSDQKSLPRKQLVDMLDKWFLLTKKGQMLPLQMVPYFEVISRVSCREGFVILLDIWQYFQSVLEVEASAANMINAAFDRSLHAPISPIQGDVTKFRESCRLIIQRNIAKLGFLFPLIYVEELKS